ncbi:MAG: DUF2029 domain-containing protein [Deltaproteobacteria bacterium]|nr:DUF2029 domain-containing protein [Deltaproteobacteria bacterium]
MFLSRFNAAEFIVLYLLISSAYLLLIFKAKNLGQASYNFLLGAAVGIRALLLFTPVELTSDIWRYIWEGKVLLAGHSPYELAPNNLELFSLRENWWHMIQHNNLTAIYPPFALYCFALFAKSILSWKAFLFICEAISLRFIILLLKEYKLPKENIFIYAFSPLALIEIMVSGHLEGLLITLILGFLYYAKREKYLGSIFIALAIATKYVAIVPYLYFLIQTGNKKSILRELVGTTTIILILFSPFILNLESLFNSFGTYLEHWKFNASTFEALGTLVRVNWQDSSSFIGIKYLLALVWFGILYFYYQAKLELSKFTVYAFITLLLLSPVVHPWYLLWFAPFLCFANISAGFGFTLTVLISYYPMLTAGQYELSLTQALLEYLPIYALLFFVDLKTDFFSHQNA